MARIPNDEWHSAAIVFDGKNSRLYVGGVEVEELKDEEATSIWLRPDEDGCKVVLRERIDDAPEQDEVTDATEHDHALSAEEVKAIYDEQKGGA